MPFKASTLFGNIQWSCPPWILFLKHKSQQAPLRFWCGCLTIIFLLLSLAYTLHWYQTRPEPDYVSASVIAPKITPNGEELKPNPLIIRFGTLNEHQEWISQSVAPLHSIGKNISSQIELSPSIKGDWYWENDNQLIFTPTADWPANTTFTVHTHADSFAPKIQLKSHDFKFTTQPFTASIKEFKFYQDPIDSEKRQLVATLEFNFPVNETYLKQNTELTFVTVEKNSVIPTKPINFTYTFDANKRTAYLHSETIEIQKIAQYVKLWIKKDSLSASGAKLSQEYSSTLLIPDNSNFMQVTATAASIVRNEKNKPEQVLSIETSLGTSEKALNQSLHVYLLPEDYPATKSHAAIKNYTWQNPGEVTPAVLSLAKPLKKEAIPTEYNYSTLHSFKFATDSPRYLYVVIDKGMAGMGGFKLHNEYKTIIAVPEYPKEINFLHQGSLLSLNGEKKLSVLVRGLPAVKFELARVLPDDVNQLITQTEGNFNNPLFINPSFNQQNISQINSEIQTFDVSDLSKQQYTILNLDRYLNKETNHGTGPKGLFLIQAQGWDKERQQELDIKANRLILITDLGLLVKDNNDGSHDVFVESISTGNPVFGANITVLGKNGLPVLSRTTNALGQAHFPALKDFVDDKAPVAYLASFENDVSFIPFNNYNRQLNFSKFDIGGLYNNSEDPANLSAYLFSDRGIYRPGDVIHLGAVVKQAFAMPQPAGLPLQITVQDPRGTLIKEEKIILNSEGMIAFDFKTNPTSPTGQYTINLYVVKDKLNQSYLGTTTVRVAEFQPDRMRIQSSFTPQTENGWITPDNLKARVTLLNLYGAPATERKVSAQISLVPEKIQFKEFPDYVFSDPLYDVKKSEKTHTETLKEALTDAQGIVEFPLNLEHYDKGTYRLTFFAEGFEADSGRSVSTQIKTLISPLPYFVGYKADGDLNFIKQSSVRHIDFIAVSPQLNQQNANGLKLNLYSLHPVTTLVKKADGTYQYQSVMKTSLVNSTDFNLSEQGTSHILKTSAIGHYLLELTDQNHNLLSQLHYNVVGVSQAPIAKNAELSVTLNKAEYQAGEDIELQITAPYAGAGLITIERDKVYAAQWFKSQTTNSVQSIRIPADFQGDGYINVAFIRDWDSPELFISPLSYSVVPFSVSHQDQTINITLHTDPIGRPGKPFKIQYQTDKPGKIILFAVDEGILQVSRHNTPDPLAFFFQKHALQVLTQQTVDQILPKFIQDREYSAAGGDDGAAEALANRLNPFKRKTDLPVAYWSGILDTDAMPSEVVYTVPDYFNGSMRIMAVAVSDDALGSAETSANIRGDFVFNPNIPTFVAPGDEFEISSTVANLLKGSGDSPAIRINVSLSDGLELVDSYPTSLIIPEGSEKTIHFRMKAKAALGSATITLTAHYQDHSASLDSTLSIRPASPLMTSIASGQTQDASQKVNVNASFYPEYRTAAATVSTTPLIYIFGLNHYLKDYPYGCTEQLTSKALPFLVMNSQSWFIIDHEQVQDKIKTTIELLSQRQMTQGGFSYWPGGSDNAGNTFASVYAMHFLTEAKEQGFSMPDELFYNGLSYLKDLAGQTPTDLDTARTQAYAIYILTRNELITSNYLANLQNYLQQHFEKIWQQDIASTYIAASYQLLKNSDEANRLISQYDMYTTNSHSDFYNKNTANAQYFYLVAKHFPNVLASIDSHILMQWINAMNNDELNTVLAGYMSLALGAYPQPQDVSDNKFSIEALFDNNESKKLTQPTKLSYQKAEINLNTKQVLFNNPQKISYFYQLYQSGFNKKEIKKSVAKGIEIYREYHDAKGNISNTAQLGEELEVHIQIRSLSQPYLPNVAIEDLLPGGFEVVPESLPKEYANYTDVREDRVNFFMGISDTVTTLKYKIKAINAGEYTIPPIYAQAMYNPNQQAHGITSKIKVIP